MMNFKFIDELGLSIDFELEAIKRDSQRYSILMYQHEGELFASEQRFGNKSKVEARFIKFFEKAKESNASLALTPEYSCPWSTIANILNNPLKWPSSKKLWVIGAESITKDEIKEFKNRFNIDNVIIYFEDNIFANFRNFVDPILYIFKVSNEGVEKLLVLIQFKTKHMGVWPFETERNALIEGDTIYIIRNSENGDEAYDSIYFMTLICSEVMDFERELNRTKKKKIDWLDKPYLIFNPQLNPEPVSRHFIDFRRFVLLSKNKEIISLNWQMNSIFNGTKIISGDNVRSAIYLSSPDGGLDENRLRHNHAKGLYYFYSNLIKHFYIFNGTPHLFLLNTPAVDVGEGPSVLGKREGPELIKVFGFEESINNFTEIEKVDDNLAKFLGTIGCTNKFLLNVECCVLEKERLASLTTGDINTKKGDWYDTGNISTIFMDEANEVNKRITVDQDLSKESTDNRKRIFEAFIELSQILMLKTNLPESVPELNDGDYHISYYKGAKDDGYKFNVVNNKGNKLEATLCFKGLASEQEAEMAYNKLRKLFPFDSKGIERVVVFYKRGTTINIKASKKANNIIHTSVVSNESILKNE